MKKRRKWRRSVISFMLASAMVLPGVGTAFAGGDTLPPREGEQGYKGEHQPSTHGYNRANILNWSPETDGYAEFMRSKVPLQERNEAFTATQANPLLDQEVESLSLMGDYGIGFFDSFQYNDQFSQYLFNFWQYLDYHASWHGMATDPQPHDLFTPGNPEGQGKFEFGVVNLPNPAYTNAAHKNGVKSLGCIFFPRTEHTEDFVYQDENGRFPIADKLVEIAKYYGFDGYFINAEEDLKPEQMPIYEEFCRAMTSQGIYIQAYASCLYGPDNEDKWGTMDYGEKNAGKFSNWLKGADDETIAANSLYMNPDPTKQQIDDSVTSMEALGLDPKKVVFQTLEAGQTGFSGKRGTLFNTLDENLVPRTGLAFLGADTSKNHLDEQVFGHVGKNSYKYTKRDNPEYQKYVFARERTWWSGALDQPYYEPFKTQQPDDYFPEELCQEILDATPDPYQTANNPKRGQANEGEDYQSWPGLAAFISERSVIDGSNFYTNFNTGHGMQYFVDGQVSNDNEWSNINIQDILPTWQWWIETEGTRLDVDFDYGEKYSPAFELNQVGGYNGGSSLVVKGKLDAENTLRLYKTNLEVKENTKISVTYNKTSATDNSKMELAVIFKNDPNTVVTFNVPQANQETDGWVTKDISLGDYAGEEIVSLGFNFDPGKETVEDYQMNIGELKVSDGSVAAPSVPTGLSIDESFETSETYISWDLDDYDAVQRYNVYMKDGDGNRTYLGGTYDDIYYIKDLYDVQGDITIQVTAVGKDGTESAPAEVVLQQDKAVRDIQVTQEAGKFDISWTNPETDYDHAEVTVTFESHPDDVYTAEAAKGETGINLEIPIMDGTNYTVRVSLMDAEGQVIGFMDQTGQLEDYYCHPYDQDVRFANNLLSFAPPSVNDWSTMYAFYKGEPIKFRSGNIGAIRGYDDMRGILINDDCGVVEVELEDYAGNRSERVRVPFHKDGMTCAAIDETAFPDPALLEAVKKVAETPADLPNVTSLDLSNSEVKELTGLRYLRNLESLNLSNCTSLEVIREQDLSLNVHLKEINLTGCTQLKAASLADTTLETIVCEDVSALSQLYFLDVSGSRFDLSEGTPEREFVDAVTAQAEGKGDFTVPLPNPTNLAYGMDVVDTNLSMTHYLFDGDTSNPMRCVWIPKLPSHVTLQFDSPKEVLSYHMDVPNDDPNVGLKDFRLQGSIDGQQWTDLSVVTGHTGESCTITVENPQAYTYYRFQIDGKVPASGPAKLTELEMTGYGDVTFTAGVKYDNQRPAAYEKEMPETVRLEKQLGGTYDLTANLENNVTIHGNDLASLKGADFIDQDYDLDKVAQNKVQYIRVTGNNGTQLTNEISLDQDGAYTVVYLTYKDAGYQARTVATQTVYVRGVTTVLEKIIAEAEELLNNGALDNTMEAVVEEFNEALAHAKEILAKDDATQQEINDATKRLLDVMAKVDWKQGDKTALQVAVDIANTIKPDLDLYVEEGKQEFLDALAKGEELLASGNAWDDEIQTATEELIKAMSNLRMAPNKDILNDMIDKASGLDLSDYTQDSAAALTSALAEAQEVAADENATQEEVDEAADTLEAAMNGLVFVNSDENNNTQDDTISNPDDTENAPVGDGTAPIKTGDAGAAGLAGLAVMSALGIVCMLRKREK